MEKYTLATNKEDLQLGRISVKEKFLFDKYVKIRDEADCISTELLLVWNEGVKRKDKGICGCSGFTQTGFDYLRPKLVELEVECEDSISF